MNMSSVSAAIDHCAGCFCVDNVLKKCWWTICFMRTAYLYNPSPCMPMSTSFLSNLWQWFSCHDSCFSVCEGIGEYCLWLANTACGWQILPVRLGEYCLWLANTGCGWRILPVNVWLYAFFDNVFFCFCCLLFCMCVNICAVGGLGLCGLRMFFFKIPENCQKFCSGVPDA